ncbi:hypothetical protein AX018_103240 [Paracidovorax anthurii]|uniref:Uncharacterized protein n=2 Tax=Paracidovorax anthurii TaxID=78229 RepID=A0A328Z5Y0_9BURK|nr:hypothetical protein AX018_103240 [Paracidovorax anthurii]
MINHLGMVAPLLERARSDLKHRALALGLDRLRALGPTLSPLISVIRETPRSLPDELLSGRITCISPWACDMLERDWQQFAPIARVALGLRYETGKLAEACSMPTIRWIALGDTAPASGDASPVLGGAIDLALLRLLGSLLTPRTTGGAVPVLPTTYHDAVHQIDSAAQALSGLDLRLREFSWLLDQIGRRLVAMTHRVCAGADPKRLAAVDIDAGFRSNRYGMRSLTAELLRLAQVGALDANGTLCREGAQAVADARRTLLEFEDCVV